MLEAIERRGFVAVLYARIFPGVPRDVANYAFGLTRVSIGAFALATLIGIAPRAFAYSALGGSLGSFDSTESIVAIATLVAMGVLGLVLVRRDLRRPPRGVAERVGSGARARPEARRHSSGPQRLEPVAASRAARRS